MSTIFENSYITGVFFVIGVALAAALLHGLYSFSTSGVPLLRRFNVMFGPITIYLFTLTILWIVSTIFCLIVWTILVQLGVKMEFWLIGLLLPLPLAAIITLAASNDTPLTVVPTSRIANLSWIGSRTGFNLREGNYYLRLGVVGLSQTKKVVPPGTDSQGFLAAEFFSFRLWNTGETENYKVELNSRNGAAVTLTVTIKIAFQAPWKWLSVDDAALLLGDKAREALRSASTKLVDLDISDAPSILAALMRGDTVIMCRIADTVGIHRQGSVIFDRSGNRRYLVAKSNSKEDIAEAREKYKKELQDHESDFDERVLKEAKNIAGEYLIEEVSVKTKLTEIMKVIGINVENFEILISDISLSKIVQAAADKAAAEPHEAESESRTAKSAQKAAEAFAETQKKYGTDAAAMGAATANIEGVKTFNVIGLAEILKTITTKKGGDA